MRRVTLAPEDSDREPTVTELIECLATFPKDLPVRFSYDSGVCVGPVKIVQECNVNGRDPEHCIVLAGDDDDMDSDWT